SAPRPPSSILSVAVTTRPRKTCVGLRMTWLEEAGFGVVAAAHRIVIENEAPDPAVFGQGSRLRADLLGGEHAFDGGKQGVSVEQLEVAGELLHAVDLPAAFDLHR